MDDKIPLEAEFVIKDEIFHIKINISDLLTPLPDSLLVYHFTNRLIDECVRVDVLLKDVKATHRHAVLILNRAKETSQTKLDSLINSIVELDDIIRFSSVSADVLDWYRLLALAKSMNQSTSAYAKNEAIINLRGWVARWIPHTSRHIAEMYKTNYQMYIYETALNKLSR